MEENPYRPLKDPPQAKDMSGRSTSPQHHSSRQSAEGDEANSVRNDYSDGDNRLTKRPRASRPKVKSGCITCKVCQLPNPALGNTNRSMPDSTC